MSSRMSASTGHFSPPAIIASLNARQRSEIGAVGLADREPRALDVADRRRAPRARSSSRRRSRSRARARSPRVTAPPGSTASMRRPAYGPARPWKYHQGMPFCAATTAVSAREQRLEQRPGVGVVVGLQPEHDDVDRPDLARVVGRRRLRREVAARAQHVDAVARASPRGSRRARRGGRRHRRGASAAPTYAPIAPAPRTAILIARRSARPGAAAGPCRSAPSGSRRASAIARGTLNGASRLARSSARAVLGAASCRQHDGGRRRARRTSRRDAAKATASATAGCCEQRLLDLVRRDLLAAAVDQLLDPARRA